jgi:hypothetical protein
MDQTHQLNKEKINQPTNQQTKLLLFCSSEHEESRKTPIFSSKDIFNNYTNKRYPFQTNTEQNVFLNLKLMEINSKKSL